MVASIEAAATIQISRDRTEVFDYLTAVERIGDWVSGVTGAELSSGVGGEHGDRYQCDYTTGGKPRRCFWC